MKRKFAGKGGFAAELGRFGETTLPFIDRRCRVFDSPFVHPRQRQVAEMPQVLGGRWVVMAG